MDEVDSERKVRDEFRAGDEEEEKDDSMEPGQWLESS